jgi:hypothetical protein
MLGGLAMWLRGLDWWQQGLLAASLFLVTFLGSLAAAAVVLVNLPADYFQGNRHVPLPAGHPIVHWVGHILRNLLGLLLILLGLLLSLPGIPGQGLLTILIGLMLVDFPGKRRLEQALVSRPRVRGAIDRLRARFARPPLLL